MILQTDDQFLDSVSEFFATHVKSLPSGSTTLAGALFARELFEESLFKKLDNGTKEGAQMRKDAAFAKWIDCESYNLQTNTLLTAFMNGHVSGLDRDLHSIILVAQDRINRLLGTFRLHKVMAGCRWGPGATADIKGSDYVDTKITKRMSVTRYAIPFMKMLIESDPNWARAITGRTCEGPFSLLKSNWIETDCTRIQTVPKNAEIDRCIDPQPTANGYLQQGVGRYFRKVLRRWSIDLDDQRPNQRAAKAAFTEGLSTIDLSSASDMLSSTLVNLLLPPSWFAYLDFIRVKSTEVNGKRFELNKFSAMGNAFTFELETLVFHALCYAVCEVKGHQTAGILVYGDDIIVPRDGYDDVAAMLNFVGFKVNATKSFKDGPYFESCGKHYYENSDVTPVYQKSLVNSPDICVRLHNKIWRWARRVDLELHELDPVFMLIIDRYISLCRECNSRCEAWDLPFISECNESDDGFLREDWELLKLRDKNSGFISPVLRAVRSSYHNLDEAAYYQYTLYTNARRSNSTPTDYLCDRAMPGKGYVVESVGEVRWALRRVYSYR